MSSENVEILRRADEAFQRGDLTAALVDMDEHITASRVAPMPYGLSPDPPAGARDA